MIPAPGETADQMIILFEERKVLCPADNVYYAYPNIYALRGTASRSANVWATSLDMMRRICAEHNVEYMCGSHSKPEIGGTHIRKELLLYADLIRFTHDQSVRWINKHLEVNEIVAKIKEMIPKRFQRGRCVEYYGTFEWSIRSVYNGYLGWYSGEMDDLYPCRKTKRGERLFELFRDVAMCGKSGDEAILECVVKKCDEILEKQDEDEENREVAYDGERFVVELMTWLDRGWKDKGKKDKEWKRRMREVKYKAIRKIASRCYSANGRNYLIQSWLEEEYGLEFKRTTAIGTVWKRIPMEWFIEAFPLHVNPLVCDSSVWNVSMLIVFEDLKRAFEVIARDGVAEMKTHELKSLDVDLDVLKKKALVVYEMVSMEWRIKKYEDEDAHKKYVSKGSEDDVSFFWSLFDFSESTVKEEIDVFVGDIESDGDVIERTVVAMAAHENKEDKEDKEDKSVVEVEKIDSAVVVQENLAEEVVDSDNVNIGTSGGSGGIVGSGEAVGDVNTGITIGERYNR